MPMIAPGTPIDEAERLADLRALQILDTPHDQRFDRVVRLARQVFGVSMAYIAMVDADRQWFKAKQGMCEKLTETGRDVSFCGHTILRDEPMVIPDATQDERFADNPMVVSEPFVKFYAGYPLRGPRGHNVATLCIADQVPKPDGLTAEEMDVFRTLAEQAEHELNVMDVIQSQRELITTKNALVSTQQALQRELDEAAELLQALLPNPVTTGCLLADHRYIASSKLGGDTLGYHDLDDEHFAVYLLDVTGHGVGSSLLASTIAKALSPQGRFDADLTDPGAVLNALNETFTFELNNHKFFTIWYGVYHRPTRTMRYATGGHHPALVVGPDGGADELGKPNMIVGVDPHTVYETESIALLPGARLYLFSDGAFEVKNADGRMLRLDGLARLIQQHAHASADADDRLGAIIADIRAYQDDSHFLDDLSFVELTVNVCADGGHAA